MTPTPDIQKPKPGVKSTFGKFFVRGLATLLPAVLTLWLVVITYGFMRDKIAAPINWGVQQAVLKFTHWPIATDDDYRELFARDSSEDALKIPPRLQEEWDVQDAQNVQEISGYVGNEEMRLQSRRDWAKDQREIVMLARRHQLQQQWRSVAIGEFYLLDLIGLAIAVVLFYFAGVIMSNVIGRRVKDRGESLVNRVPLIRRVYPAVKQVTDFFFADKDNPLQFSQVVAVEYPRKGLWSVGLVTGDTMRDIQVQAGVECLTVFVPSSPTPFTGYVITVPRDDTIDLKISIEDALKFAVSGGVLVPPSQTIDRSSGQLFEPSEINALPNEPTGDLAEPAVPDAKTP